MGTTTPRLVLYKPAPGDAAATYDTEFPANMDTLDNSVLHTVLTTQGDIFVRGASDVQRLAAGSTSGHVLTSNGAAALPSYQAPGAATHPDIVDHLIWMTD